MKRLLITGAAGHLGSICRKRLTHLAETLVLSDIADMGEAAPHEEIVVCSLDDRPGVEAMVEGCDGIVHLGGQTVEASWDTMRRANFDGTFNIFDAARKSSVTPRILFASSNHAIGYYPQSQRIDSTVPHRPDGLYGLSKSFGESLASLYHDKFGIETASVRIGSCFAEPTNHRMLATWLSPDDFIRLIECVFRVPRLGCPVIFGASANDESWWDNREVAYLGWRPQDNSEAFRAKLDAAGPRPGKDEIVSTYQGGVFVGDPIYD